MDLMRRRREILAQGDVLPSGYQRLAYLSNPNGAYIDTGSTVDKGCIISITFEVEENSTNRVIYGWRWSGTFFYEQQLYINSNQSNENLIVIGRPATSTDGGVGQTKCYQYDTKTHLVIDTYSETVKVNGASATFHYNLADGKAFRLGSSEYNPYLFALDNMGSATAIGTDVKIYEYKVEQNGQTLLHYIPCKSPNNMYGMYDLVARQFIGSSNANAFTGA